MRSSFLSERKGKVYFSGRNESDSSYLRLALPEPWSTRDPWWYFPAARAIEERQDDASRKTGRRFSPVKSKWNLVEREQQGKSPRESHCTTIITITDWATPAICRQLRAISWPWRHSPYLAALRANPVRRLGLG